MTKRLLLDKLFTHAMEIVIAVAFMTGGYIVKHLHSLSRIAPGRATKFQDFVCDKVIIVNDVITAFGGASPMMGYLNGKCVIPVPNDTTTF